MPDRHWIVCYNSALEEYRFMRWMEEWMPFKYCAKEDVQPDWIQLGIYENEDDAQSAFAKYLTK